MSQHCLFVNGILKCCHPITAQKIDFLLSNRLLNTLQATGGVESTVLESTGTSVDGSVSVIGGGRGSVEGMHMMLLCRLSSTIDLFQKW